MSTTLTALEEVVTRHGRAALDDPLTLTAALRSLTDPPPDDDVTALADAARAGAADRLRAAVEDGAPPDQALDAAAGADPTDRTRWATAQIGAALGLLPRSLAADPPAAAAGDADTVRLTPPAGAGGDDATRTADRDGTAAAGTAGNRGRKRALLLIGAVVVLLLGVVGGALLLGRDPTGAGTPEAAAPGPTPAGGAPAEPGGGTATPETPADPRAAFTDPVLRATAEPYLRIPGTTCTRREPTVVVIREQVVCRLGTSGSGIFARYFDPTTVVNLRQFMGTDETVVPGSRRELRWEYVEGRPGVRAGIPVGQDRDGVGTRVRWLTKDPAAPLLYFDEEATGTIAQLSLLDGGDQEQLRRFWADPVG